MQNITACLEMHYSIGDTTLSRISLDDDCSEIKWSVIQFGEMINAGNSALGR